MAQFFQLWDEVHTVELNLEEDTIRWKLSSDGLFTVSSAYNLFFMAREICPFSELIWHIKAPSRVRFFLWLAAKGRCLTADNLGKRGWQHEDCCSLCQSEAEDCLHLFVTCAFTRRVWRMMQGWIGINFLLPTENEPALADWWMKARMAFRTGYRSIFDSVFALTCWLLWKECNARVFEQKFRSIEQLVQDIKEEAIVWKTTGVFTTCNSEIT
ncbi:Os02g0118800 [Oryza sativa Japonica Group]|nr:Os02g0118800 [Oryza sativa Japonica Group]|eukprot:NP_001045695.2 Os02g0118800 [Oryza sativa Japonica Group]